MKMPFGQYKHSLSSLPDDYLDWLCTIAHEPLLSHVQKEIRRRYVHQAAPHSAPAVPLSMARRIVTCGFRHLAQELHPDHGGDHRAMLELNAAHDWLRKHVEVLT
jgi:hypothetical protein